MKMIPLLLLPAVLLLVACGQTNRPQQAAVEVTVNVVTAPAGAEVFVDGGKTGNKTPASLSFDPKGHLLEIRLPGYETTWRRIPPNSKGTLEVPMKPLTAAIHIDSHPSGASVSVDDVVRGTTPMFLPDVKLGSHKAQVEMGGFDPRSFVFDVNGPRPAKYLVRLDSVYGTVRIVSRPPGAQIILNGQTVGRTPKDGPLLVEELKEGDYRVVARLQNYRDLEYEFSLKRKDDKLVNLPEMVELAGSLEVRTEPSEARVIIDGNLQKGLSPLVIKEINPGKVTIRVEKDGFDPQEESVTVSPGMNREVRFDLQSNVGCITLRTEPPGCTVYVDQRKVGDTEKDPIAPLTSKLFMIPKLEANSYVVRVEHPNCEPLAPVRAIVEKGKAKDLGTLKLKERWRPTHTMKQRAGPRSEGRLISQDDKGNIVWEPKPGVRLQYSKDEVEYCLPIK